MHKLSFALRLVVSVGFTMFGVEGQAFELFVSANIVETTPSYIDLGTTNDTSYAAIEDADLQMTINSNSAAASIPCSGTNPSGSPSTTTSTCTSGEESIGISFDIGSPGVYEACVTLAHFTGAEDGDYIGSAFRLIETANDAQTELQGGTVKMVSRHQERSASSTERFFSIRFCEVFTFDTTGQKTIRLQEQTVSGGASSKTNKIAADGSPAYGSRDIHFLVRGLN